MYPLIQIHRMMSYLQKITTPSRANGLEIKFMVGSLDYNVDFKHFHAFEKHLNALINYFK